MALGDRWVPWHLAGSVQGAVDASAEVARHGWGPRVQQGMAQAYLNQVTGGADGGGPFG